MRLYLLGRNVGFRPVCVIYYFIMKAGIKIGLRDYQNRLPKTQASVCEVYFRIDKKKQYDGLFSQLKARNIQAGLHFWGFLDDNIMYNLAFPDEKIQTQTLTLIKETIDLAASHHCYYVNVHAGYYNLTKVNLDKGQFSLINRTAGSDEGNAVLKENLKILHQYAQNEDILLLTETLSARENPNWLIESSRFNPINVGSVSCATLFKLALENNLYLTNDFGHTISEEISSDRDLLFQKLYEKTKKLAPYTKLIHPNTTKPPFNGVDTHNGITTEDFSQQVLPDKNQLLKLLQIFKNRNDIWLIPEPYSNHEKNYLILQKMIDFIEK